MVDLTEGVLSMRKSVDKAAQKKERLAGEKDALTKQIKKEFGVDSLKGVEKKLKETEKAAEKELKRAKRRPSWEKRKIKELEKEVKALKQELKA